MKIEILQMNDDQNLYENPVYTISIAAQLLGISLHTLRMYEREGLIVAFKTKSNRRLYSESDLARIRRIRRNINERKIGINCLRVISSLIPCWIIIECSKSDRENCKAFSEYHKPCWMYKHTDNICENIDCRECEVYKISADLQHIKEIIMKSVYKIKNSRFL